MNIRILGILLKKEVWLMIRNPFIPRMIVAMPVMVMLILPLVANLDVRNIDVAVVDHDRSEMSKRIMSDMDASGTITVRCLTSSYTEAMYMVENGEADAVITIPASYEKNIGEGKMPALSLDADGVNATKGMLGARYASQSAMGTVARWKSEHAAGMPVPDVSVIYLYNPTLDFSNYMIPALMVVLIIIICGFLPALNLVSEKATGTIEAINVTPVGKFTFVLSKLIPYWVVGILVVTVGMLVGWLVYGLVPAGSLMIIYLAAILFSFVMSGLGVSIANRSATMMQSIFVMFAFIMVFQLMGGLFTPIASMPRWAQFITYAVPPRYYIEIMRSVYLKGTSFSQLVPQFVALAFFAVLFSMIASLTYTKRS